MYVSHSSLAFGANCAVLWMRKYLLHPAGSRRWASARARPRHGSRGNEGLGVDIGSFGRCQYPAHLRVAQPYGCDLRSMHDNMQLGGCI